MCESSEYYEGYYEFSPKYFPETENMPNYTNNYSASVPVRTPNMVERMVLEDKVAGASTPEGDLDLERLEYLVRLFNASTFLNSVNTKDGSLTAKEQKSLLEHNIVELYRIIRRGREREKAKKLVSQIEKK